MNNTITAKLDNFFNYFRNATVSNSGAPTANWDDAYYPDKSIAKKRWIKKEESSRDRSLPLPNRLVALRQEQKVWESMLQAAESICDQEVF